MKIRTTILAAVAALVLSAPLAHAGILTDAADRSSGFASTGTLTDAADRHAGAAAGAVANRHVAGPTALDAKDIWWVTEHGETMPPAGYFDSATIPGPAADVAVPADGVDWAYVSVGLALGVGLAALAAGAAIARVRRGRTGAHGATA